jgi:CheY-like chemotaxis protein
MNAQQNQVVRIRPLPPVRPLRVLVVNDSRDVRMTLGILLRSEGMEVKVAKGGMQVPQAVAEFQPDAVLLDLEMSDRNGLDVAQDLKRCYGARCPMLVAVTDRNSDADRHRSAASGFRYHVAKPYDPDRLLKIVRTITPK